MDEINSGFMQPGRPQKFRLAAGGLSGAWREVLVIASDNRLRISVDVSRRRPWLAPGHEVLAVLCPDLMVKLLPQSEAVAVEERLQLLASGDDAEPEALELAIRNRYLRLRVNSDSRMVLPIDVRLCLGLDPIEPAYVSLTISRQLVELQRADPDMYTAAEELLEGTGLP